MSLVKRGRKAKLTAHDVAFVRSNPDQLSNKELAQALAVSLGTIIKVKSRRGAYADHVVV